MQACRHVVLQCFTIGHFRSRDSGSKAKNLSCLQKFVKTKPKQLVALNCQGKHVIMWFRSLNLSHVIWGQTSKDLSSLWQLITIKPSKLEFSNFPCNCVALWQGFLTGGKFIPWG